MSNVSSVADSEGPAESSSPMVKIDSVLVADDDAVSLALLESRLKKWQLDVITAKDGLYTWHEMQKETAPV
jgi:CheY-like chemotaxis protein